MNYAIDLEMLSQLDDFNQQEIMEDISTRINSSNLLLCGSFPEGSSSGKFQDSLWVMSNHLTHSYIYCNFSSLSDFTSRTLKLDVESMVKLWLAHSYLYGNDKEPKTLKLKYEPVCTFIKASSNFSEVFINSSTGNKLMDYLEDMDVADTRKGVIISCIQDFIYYLNNELDITDSIYVSYEMELSILIKKYPAPQGFRNLPSSKDIVLFSHILNLFHDECKNNNLRLLYMPILIWWKLTTVIPMHISEVTTKLFRNCIEKKNGRCYLNVNRVKQRTQKTKVAFPVLDWLEISEDIYNMIDDYIISTNKYGKSKTLFSYRAHKDLTTKLTREDLVFTGQRDNHIRKYNEDFFSSVIFGSLLDSFYSIIVHREYKINSSITQIAPGDTRHFAFFSLLIQGLSEIEIALLGGHTTIQAQQHYQQGIKYYVDSQLYELLYKRMASKNYVSQQTFQTLYEIWNNMTPKCDEEIKHFRRLKIGWCTSQFKDPNDFCEDLECCYFCSKFWIEKTVYNLEEMKKDVIDYYLRRTEHQMNNDMSFLKSYMDNTSLIKTCGDLVIDRTKWTQIRTAASKVKSDCEQVAKIKYSLLDLHKIDGHLQSLSDALMDMDNRTNVDTNPFKMFDDIDGDEI